MNDRRHYFCDDCGKEFNVECLYPVESENGGRVLCKECVLKTDNYTFCLHCGSFTKKDYETVSGNYICNICAANRYDYCICCGKYINRYYDDARSINEGNCCFVGYYCRGCLHDALGNGDIYYCADCESYYCSENPCEHNSNNIHHYDYRPNNFNFYGTNENLFIGVELEVSVDYSVANKLIRNGEDFIYCKNDGSVDHGFEIVSHPATFEYHKNNEWEDIFFILNNNHAESDKSCGLHFHISRRYFNDNGLRNLDYFVNKHSKFIEGYCGREFNTYCHLKYNRNYWNYGKSDSRYEAVNYTNLHTVEVRFCASTVDYNTFIQRMNFVYDIVRFCNSKEKMRDCTIENFKEFIGEDK